MRVLQDIEPKDVFYYFEEISRIPHPSGQEKAISDYLVRFGKEHGLEYYQDDAHNVILIKEASDRYENEPAIIIQGHMDMVCEKESGCGKDMQAEGLDLETHGDWISAKGTTLGGDDGFAVAMALALLASDTLKHPRLEFVCTSSEEIGMLGATALDCSPLKGRLLINLDSEEEGVITCACAGGGTACITLPVERQNPQKNSGEVYLQGNKNSVDAHEKENAEYTIDGSIENTGINDNADIYYNIDICGLAGGHSGTGIDKGHPNAAVLMMRLLRTAEPSDELRLVSFSGGGKDNAIPRESSAVAAVKKGTDFLKKVTEEAEHITAEYASAEPNMTIVIQPSGEADGASSDTETDICPADKESDEKAELKEKQPLTLESTQKLILLFSSLPDGVVWMSSDIPGMVETSLNFGISELKDEEFVLRACVRSSVGTAFSALCEKLKWIALGMGAKFAMEGVYPAWEWLKESKLREKIKRIYSEMFGKEPVITAVHAGLEGGIFSSKLPGLDAVSLGPDIIDIHTPAERMSISSVKRTYELLVKVIEERSR